MPGEEGRYEASNLGRIRSVPRVVLKQGFKHPLRGVILSPSDNGAGYLVTSLGGGKKVYVHRVVAITFLVNPQNLKQVNHKNLDKGDNRICNLEWVTPLQNAIHFQNSYLGRGRQERVSP